MNNGLVGPQMPGSQVGSSLAPLWSCGTTCCALLSNQSDPFQNELNKEALILSSINSHPSCPHLMGATILNVITQNTGSSPGDAANFASV